MPAFWERSVHMPAHLPKLVSLLEAVSHREGLPVLPLGFSSVWMLQRLQNGREN